MYSEWLERPELFAQYLMALPGCDDPSLVLDRINNDGHYEPGNLEYVTRSESQLNKRKPGPYRLQPSLAVMMLRDGTAERIAALRGKAGEPGYTFKQIAQCIGLSCTTVKRVYALYCKSQR